MLPVQMKPRAMKMMHGFNEHITSMQWHWENWEKMRLNKFLLHHECEQKDLAPVYNPKGGMFGKLELNRMVQRLKDFNRCKNGCKLSTEDQISPSWGH